MSSSNAPLAVRLIYMDHYMTSPLRTLDVTYGNQCGVISRVPVVRVFGTTPAGQKCCLHIHKLFPYFFVRLPPHLAAVSRAQMEVFTMTLMEQLNHAINVEASKGSNNASSSTTNWNDKYVFNVSPVRGRAFYGYHRVRSMINHNHTSALTRSLRTKRSFSKSICSILQWCPPRLHCFVMGK
jgi:DNA polymerase zeta